MVQRQNPAFVGHYPAICRSRSTDTVSLLFLFLHFLPINHQLRSVCMFVYLSACLPVCVSVYLLLPLCLRFFLSFVLSYSLSFLLSLFLSSFISLPCLSCCLSVFFHRLGGLVVKASVSRAEDPGFESRLRRDFFRSRVIPVTLKLALQWLPCQAPGVIGSALGLVGPVSVYCDWVR